jgi:predicted Fe-S protein YdhL (DUF1289 family)
LLVIVCLAWIFLDHHPVASSFDSKKYRFRRNHVGPLLGKRSITTTFQAIPNQDDENAAGDGTAPASTTTTSVPLTPCNRICRYNANVYDGQVCIGCFRETFEIGAWQSMSASEKYFALLDAKDRLEEYTDDGIAVEGAVSMEELERQAEFWKQQADA